MSNPKKQKYFVDSWLDDPQFKDWQVKDKKNTRGRCSVCHNDDPQFKDWLVKDKERAQFSVCHEVIELSCSGNTERSKVKNTEMLCQK